MHLRLCRIARPGRVYQYAQLVESYRRSSDGLPAHRVIANLGNLTATEIANLRLALTASREGKSVAMATAQRPLGATVLENLVYLDAAVALEMWRHWNLDELIAEAMPTGQKEAADALVVAALTIQRCIAPGSKLYAQRWYPRTALPELLGLAPGQFNNTRIHRVLERLDQAGGRLQQLLSERRATRQGTFVALFLDVTDTWFSGRGPELAESGKTKEGLYRRKVGIVLMCDEQGFPLRWQVVAGRDAECQSMTELANDVARVSWIEQTPVICDRAMGATVHLNNFIQKGLRFVTALNSTEYDYYTAGHIPHQALTEVDALRDDALQRAGEAVEHAGMQKVKEDLYVLDLGEVERKADPDAVATTQCSYDLSSSERTSEALKLALQLQTALDQGDARDYRDLSRAYGVKRQRISTLLQLLRLSPPLQQEILAGKARELSVRALLRVANQRGAEAQERAFSDELAAVAAAPIRSRQKGATHSTQWDQRYQQPEPIRVRTVVCFNPRVFVEKRMAADEELAAVHSFVRALNQRLALPRSRRDQRHVYAEVDHELRRRNLLDVFEIAVQATDEGERRRLEVELKFQQAVWHTRRLNDGFTVVVAHPALLKSGAELAILYRAKDAVEKDFQTIKSVVQLRPVRHRTDPKVRAHVTLCMLALFLERTLERRLAGTAPERMTAAALFEVLGNIHLNRMLLRGSDTPIYTVTRASREQADVIHALGLDPLLDDRNIGGRIAAR